MRGLLCCCPILMGNAKASSDGTATGCFPRFYFMPTGTGKRPVTCRRHDIKGNRRQGTGRRRISVVSSKLIFKWALNSKGGTSVSPKPLKYPAKISILPPSCIPRMSDLAYRFFPQRYISGLSLSPASTNRHCPLKSLVSG